MKNCIGVIHFPINAFNFELEELKIWLIRNLDKYQSGGFESVILQDQVIEHKSSIETIIRVATLCHVARSMFPTMRLGLILDSNDCEAAVKIALLSKFDFVRFKVFVGAMVKNTGIVEGCGPKNFRLIEQAKKNLEIFADVYDKTGTPLGNISYLEACKSALTMGASSLILTGASLIDSKQMIDTVSSKINAPLFIGGGVTLTNLNEILNSVDGCIVSSCLLEDDKEDEWSFQKISEFVQEYKSHSRT